MAFLEGVIDYSNGRRPSDYREKPTGLSRFSIGHQLGYRLFGNKHEQPIDMDPYNIAALTRQQYRDYIDRFQPREDWLINYATNENKPLEDANRARGYVDQAFANAPGTLDRRMKGLGVSMTPEQQQSFQRQSTYQKGLSQVDAMNRASQNTWDRQTEILTGSSPSIDLSRVGRNA